MIGLTDIEKINFYLGKMECFFCLFVCFCLSFSALLIFNLSLFESLMYDLLFNVFMEQWPNGSGIRFLIQGSHVRNHWVAPRSTSEG